MSFGSRYSRMEQVKVVEDSLYKVWSDIVCLGRSYHFKIFKGSLTQILLGPFLNTLTHLIVTFHLKVSVLNNCLALTLRANLISTVMLTIYAAKQVKN